MKNPMVNYVASKFIGIVILGTCVAVAVIYGVANVVYNMGMDSGMNKILNEQEEANSVAHTEWADFGVGMYIIGGEVISTDEENQTTTFELISGTQLTSKLGVFDSDAVYMLTVDDCNTPDYMNDDVIVVVWEAK